MSIRSNVGRKLAAGALASFTVLAGAAVALATPPVKGKTYRGSVTGSSTETVSFKVNKTGKTVVSLAVPAAPGCQATGVTALPPQSAPITSKGTFTATIPLETGSRGYTKPAGSETMTGTFLAGGKEKGTIKTQGQGSLSCSKTVSYTTH